MPKTMLHSQTHFPTRARDLPRPMRGRQRGLTLIELMVGVSVLAILSTVGVPSFLGAVHNAEVAVIANELTLALNLARSEAVRRGEDVRLCASADGATCAGEWRQGWIVRTVRGGQVVKVWQARYPDLGPTVADDAPRSIRFDSLGACRDGAVTFTIGLTPDIVLRARQIELTAAGRPSLTTLVREG